MTSLTLKINQLLSESDFVKVERYIPYITCNICSQLLSTPKYCLICKCNYCDGCVCKHTNSSKLLRHEAELMSVLLINCKYNCVAAVSGWAFCSPFNFISIVFVVLSYFALSIYSILNISKLEITSRDLKQAQLYNKTLTVLHDNIRAFITLYLL